VTEFNIPEMSGLREGIDLPKIEKHINQKKINLYAEASQDFNPIHIDESFAKNTAAGGTIAHGMLILSYISQMMTNAFGQSWLNGGKLDIRFKTPARPGDTVTINGKIDNIDHIEEKTFVKCGVLCSNQNGDTIIMGEAQVEVKNGENID
jgi:acyl dehydratase